MHPGTPGCQFAQTVHDSTGMNRQTFNGQALAISQVEQGAAADGGGRCDHLARLRRDANPGKQPSDAGRGLPGDRDRDRGIPPRLQRPDERESQTNTVLPDVLMCRLQVAIARRQEVAELNR
jgi:hypothetical protein